MKINRLSRLLPTSTNPSSLSALLCSRLLPLPLHLRSSISSLTFRYSRQGPPPSSSQPPSPFQSLALFDLFSRLNLLPFTSSHLRPQLPRPALPLLGYSKVSPPSPTLLPPRLSRLKGYSMYWALAIRSNIQPHSNARAAALARMARRGWARARRGPERKWLGWAVQRSTQVAPAQRHEETRVWCDLSSTLDVEGEKPESQGCALGEYAL